MKKIFLLAAIALFSAPAFAQNVSKITIGDNGAIETIAFELEPNVMLNIKEDGSIINWGEDVYKESGVENWAGKLKDYMGRIEYYSATDNEAFRGKVKSIGRTTLTYYASYENESLRGKLKSVGPNNIDYYLAYDDESTRGKIKSIGSLSVTWYSSFNNEAYRGKLKSIGSTELTYYSSVDDKAYKGRLKSIGGSQFTYYSSYDRQEYRGRIKTGNQVQVINSIKYFIKN